MKTFGERLRAARENQNLSLDDLASETGISRAYLWKLEMKPNANPSLDRLQKLADALGTTVGTLAPPLDPKAETVDIPRSLRQCQDKYEDLTEEDVRELARIEFRGGHPSDPEDWYQLFLQLRRSIGER